MVSAYGLRFRGAASPIDERTSYDVFAHSCPSFKDYFDLEFNMALYSTESVGYVLRVKGADEGQIFNLFFDFRGDDILFRLNQEGKCVLMPCLSVGGGDEIPLVQGEDSFQPEAG